MSELSKNFLKLVLLYLKDQYNRPEWLLNATSNDVDKIPDIDLLEGLCAVLTNYENTEKIGYCTSAIALRNIFSSDPFRNRIIFHPIKEFRNSLRELILNFIKFIPLVKSCCEYLENRIGYAIPEDSSSISENDKNKYFYKSNDKVEHSVQSDPNNHFIIIGKPKPKPIHIYKRVIHIPIGNVDELPVLIFVSGIKIFALIGYINKDTRQILTIASGNVANGIKIQCDKVEKDRYDLKFTYKTKVYLMNRFREPDSASEAYVIYNMKNCNIKYSLQKLCSFAVSDNRELFASIPWHLEKIIS